MAMAKLVPTEDIKDIQRRMAQIRRELHAEVKGAVEGAQALTDWRSHIRNHPWLALGVATAVGYLIVPRRRPPEKPTIVAVNPVATPPAVSLSASSPKPERSRSRWGFLGKTIGLVAPIAVRAAQNYAIQYMEQWLAAQQGGMGPAIGPGLAPQQGPDPRTFGGGGFGPRPSASPGGPRRPGEGR